MAGSVTKLAGNHTFKFGIQWDHSRKVQIYGASGSIPFQGTINFGNDSNNPLDSGFGFANAALGIFSSYSQQAKFIEGNWVYDSIEGFVQDTWKVNGKLSLDYGLRITHQGPQYDVNLQSSNFLPEKWSASQAPLLYTPGARSATRPCPVANRVALDPRTRTSLGQNTSGARRHHRPEHRRPDSTASSRQARGSRRRTTPGRRLRSRPVFGFAYDVTGSPAVRRFAAAAVCSSTGHPASTPSRRPAIRLRPGVDRAVFDPAVHSSRGIADDTLRRLLVGLQLRFENSDEP